jgi:flagellar hook-associated protein FlgK
MNSISSVALSGIHAAQLSLGASAHNIANAQTPGFHRQQVAQAEQAGGGVSATLVRSPREGESLADDIVGQRVSSYALQANVLTLKTERQTLGSLLDLQA